MATTAARKGPGAPSLSHPTGISANGSASKRSASKAQLTEPKPKRQRTKAGCITCRVRGKKCDEQRVDDGETCETCKRLRLHCLGFQDRRPDWLRSKENIKIWRKRVTEFLLSQGLVKGHAGCGLRPGNVPDASLTLEDMRRDLDAPTHGGEDADSPSGNVPYERDMESETPHPFNGMLGHPLTLPPLHNIPPEPENPHYIPNLPKRFENAIGGVVDEDNRHRWVPPPPFGPPLKTLEDDNGPPLAMPPPRAAMPIPPHPQQQQQQHSNHKLPANFMFNQPFNPDYNPKYYRDPQRPAHNPSGSSGSLAEIKTDPSYSANNSVSGASGPSPVQTSYNGVPSNSGGSRPSSMYNIAAPSLSPSSTSHVSTYPSKSEPGAGHSQPPPNPSGYSQNLEAGRASGPERHPLRASQSLPAVPFDNLSQSQQPSRYDAHRFEPYRRPSIPYPRGSASSDSSGARNDTLSLQTSSVRPGASISPSTQLSGHSLSSTSSGSFETGGYGSYPPAADPYAVTYASGMSIQNLLQASTSNTPIHDPPSSVVSTINPTPTTAYPNDEQDIVETNGTTVVATTYFQGYPTNTQYGDVSQPSYSQILIQPQPSPSMSLSDFYIQRYFTHVIGVQYRLANLQTLPHVMFNLSERSVAVKTSISLLSVLYFEAQQLAQAGIGGTVLGAENMAGQAASLGDADSYSGSGGYMQPQSLDLGVPGLGLINASSLLPSNTTNSRAQFDLLYARIKKLLDEARITKGERYDEGDAMACLHVISAFLFSGGRGNWDQFLHISAQWVWGRISDYSGNVVEALGQMDSMSRFIFRTTMWMDVFGSISLCRTPRFLQIYRSLFRPGALDTSGAIAVETNMDRVMGCPNEIVLAFAEIANLEARKVEALQRFSGQQAGILATMDANGFPLSWAYSGTGPADLFRQELAAIEIDGIEIERLIPEAYGPAALPMNRLVEIQVASENTPNGQKKSPEFTDLNLFGSPPDAFVWLDSDASPSSNAGVAAHLGTAVETAGCVDPDEDKRGKIAEVFRNSARVYLHSVTAGCDPLVPKIRRAVQATIHALENLGASPLDRSLIFPLTITGCLAATRHEVDFCIRRLSAVGRDAESLGNCLAARQLIGRVWEKRIEGGFTSRDGSELVGGPRSSISWRTVMMEMSRHPLLLV